jgi:hypothetical protein
MPITYDKDKRELYIPDLGVTFRSAMSVAAQVYEETGNRNSVVVYKGVRIASLRVASKMNIEDLKGRKHARP